MHGAEEQAAFEFAEFEGNDQCRAPANNTNEDVLDEVDLLVLFSLIKALNQDLIILCKRIANKIKLVIKSEFKKPLAGKMNDLCHQFLKK